MSEYEEEKQNQIDHDYQMEQEWMNAPMGDYRDDLDPDGMMAIIKQQAEEIARLEGMCRTMEDELMKKESEVADE